ncbi:20945_t:CDS:2, partial [Gigaspora rosea]
MAEEALNATAKTMTTFANALGRGSEKSLLKINFYRGNRTQNPSPARQLELACAYIKDNAQECLQGAKVEEWE